MLLVHNETQPEICDDQQSDALLVRRCLLLLGLCLDLLCNVQVDVGGPGRFDFTYKKRAKIFIDFFSSAAIKQSGTGFAFGDV